MHGDAKDPFEERHGWLQKESTVWILLTYLLFYQMMRVMWAPLRRKQKITQKQRLQLFP